jgi:all-trans-8'-apo-beta-carotenal 15,15'-oxygenase
MDRRQFLMSSGSLAALSATGAALVSTPSAATTPSLFKSQFASAVAADPRLTPYRGAAQDLLCEALSIEGKLPTALQGRFYRNGPAKFERGEERYQHWFDGDGMVQQFTFTGSGIAHRGRFVQTAKFKAESEANRFLVPALGTGIRPQMRITGPDAMNTANTNAIEHAGRVLAMWEGGSAMGMDVATLATQGPITWQEGWEQMPFSAHPKLDPQGNLWNFGTSGNTLMSYHIDAQGRPAHTQRTTIPFDRKRAGGMNHDMAITERFMVVPIPPLTLHFDLLAQGRPAAEVMQLHKQEALRVWIAPKDDIAAGTLFELPHDMVFHVGNAFERRTANGTEIVLNYVGSRGGNFLTGSAVDIMRGVHTTPGDSTLRLARFNMETRQAMVSNYDGVPEEFPRLDPRFIGRPASYLLSATSWRADAATSGFHGIQLRNVESGKTERFDYGPGAIVEEHIIVAQPGSAREREAWVIGTTFDVGKQKTSVNVFNAANIADGPLARAWLPYWLPLGFHGNFTPA